MAFEAGIWNGTLGALRSKVTAFILLIIKTLCQYWQIGHILGRTRKTNIMIRIIYGSYNGRIIYDSCNERIIYDSCNGRIILLVVPLFVVPTELTLSLQKNATQSHKR